jgi:hypothetical protein
MAKRKKSVATELPKEVIEKEKSEWEISLMSSKWFVILVLLLAGIIWYGFLQHAWNGFMKSREESLWMPFFSQT